MQFFPIEIPSFKIAPEPTKVPSPLLQPPLILAPVDIWT